MKFLKRPYVIRRYSEPEIIHGYTSIPYEDKVLQMDIQTEKDTVITSSDGDKSVQSLKVFCDDEILVENQEKQQKADRLWYQGKWFTCRSSRLSENTPLRHWTATFIECLDSEPGPDSEESEVGDEPGESEGSDL